MGKINLLQPEIFNMIAAGEVVERPASVVKELVENSLDAGATQIDVYIADGGIKCIQVSDNGVGIAPDDMRTAFLPHATSKLKEITDLDTVSTLGFRGEALASIASVSEVTMISRVKGCESASKIVLEAGKIISETEDSRVAGTSVKVENLFFNTPARLKFLKKPSSEQRAICDLVERMALANHRVAMTLASEDEILFSQEGGTLHDALYSVFSRSEVEKLLKVDYKSSSGVIVTGYTSDTGFTASTRTRQTVIVNGRVVENSTVTAAVEKAYQDFLMKRNYPIFVLDIIVPFDLVDVNVHPAKTEVRFRNTNMVFGAVFHAVQEAVTAYAASSGINLKSDPEETSECSDNEHAFGIPYGETYTQTRIDTASLYGRKNRPAALPADGYYPSYSTSSGRDFPAASDARIQSYEIDYSRPEADSETDKIAADNSQYEETDGKDFANSLDASVFDGKIIGQIFSTYLIVERDNIVYIIDQHAAHERILYDKLISQLNEEYSQALLIPYKFKLTAAETEYFEKIIPSLRTMGFDIDTKFGNYFVYSVPAMLSKMNFQLFLDSIFENMLDDGQITVAQIMKETICREACRAAIKGGENLSREQIEAVVKSFTDEQGKLPSKCPHGRPAVIALTKRDFEKLFKRIV